MQTKQYAMSNEVRACAVNYCLFSLPSRLQKPKSESDGGFEGNNLLSKRVVITEKKTHKKSLLKVKTNKKQKQKHTHKTLLKVKQTKKERNKTKQQQPKTTTNHGSGTKYNILTEA